LPNMAAMTNAPDLIASSQACERLGIDRSTLSRWVQLGKITPAMRLPGNRGAMLFDPAAVDTLAADLAAERALREKHGACPLCEVPTWHNGDPCPEAVAS
jgi:hypothetical protein